jgi:hypothetical protein
MLITGFYGSQSAASTSCLSVGMTIEPARCRISRSKGGSKTEFKSQVAVEIGIHRPTKSLSNATTNNEAKRKLADNGTACGLERGLSG